MKIKKILITFSILVFFSLILESICPKIVIYGAPNIKAKVQVVMDFYDKYYDGDVSILYVDKLKNSTKEKQLNPKKYILFNYPIIYDKKGSKNFIIMYYMYDNENTSFHRIYINADLLYFHRIEFSLDDSGQIINSYIKKYPWSKKIEYNL